MSGICEICGDPSFASECYKCAAILAELPTDNPPTVRISRRGQSKRRPHGTIKSGVLRKERIARRKRAVRT